MEKNTRQPEWERFAIRPLQTEEQSLRHLLTPSDGEKRIAKADVFLGAEKPQTVAYLFDPDFRHSFAISAIQERAQREMRTHLAFLSTATITLRQREDGAQFLLCELGDSGYCRATYGFDSPKDPHEREGLLHAFQQALRETLAHLGILLQVEYAISPKHKQLLLTFEEPMMAGLTPAPVTGA